MRLSFVVLLAAVAGVGGCVRASPTPAPAATVAQPLAVTLPATPPDAATARVVGLLGAHGLPVTRNEGGIVTAVLPRHGGTLGAYQITVRATVLPAPPSGASVTLRGEETAWLADGRPGRTQPLDATSRGRAAAVWGLLRAVADSLRADSVRTTAAAVTGNRPLPNAPRSW